MSGPKINDFLIAFSSSDQKYCLSLPVLWTVTMEGALKSSINTVLDYAGEKWSAKTSPDEYMASSDILVAQEVTIPNESSSFQAINSGSGMGGFLPSYGLDSRSDFLSRSFTINFLETNKDLEHEYIRPWMIALGIKGLVEEGVSLKSTITVRQYTNTGKLKKGFKFIKAFPINVEGFTLNYNNTDFTIKSVTFACQNYEQL
jgi:hypothetical protein